MVTRREALLGAAMLAVAPRVSAADLRGDIAILRHAYETLHPGLYRYTTPAEMNARFDALAASWGSTSSTVDAYLSLSKFLATVKCGHTYANFFNQKKAVAEALFAGRDKLPFHFRWIDSRMIVTGNSELPRGSEIVSIDGKPSRAILSDLMPFARADGSNDAKRVAQLGVQGFDKIETFDVFFALTRSKPGQPFSVIARMPGGSSRSLSLAPIDLAARRAQMKQPADDNAVQWTLAFDAGNIARLTMPNWALYDSKWDWRAFLDKAFDEIARRDTRALIVDLRGNEGGLDCGDEILARCIDRPLARAAYERRVRYRRIPSDLEPYLDTWDPSFKDWGDDAQPVDDRFFRLIERDGESRAGIAPKGPRFKGRLIVLVASSNSSATFQFAQLVRANRLGQLIGEPTGGNLRGINGGAFFFLRLPASNLEADVPLIGTFPATPQPDAGIVPDIVVADTPQDIAAGRDAVLERALGLARS